MFPGIIRPVFAWVDASEVIALKHSHRLIRMDQNACNLFGVVGRLEEQHLSFREGEARGAACRNGLVRCDAGEVHGGLNSDRGMVRRSDNAELRIGRSKNAFQLNERTGGTLQHIGAT